MQSAAFFGFFYREEEEEDDGGCRFQLCRGDCFHSFTQGINSRTNTGGAAPFGSKVTFNNEMGIDRFTRRSFSGPIAYAAATFLHHSLSLLFLDMQSQRVRDGGGPRSLLGVVVKVSPLPPSSLVSIEFVRWPAVFTRIHFGIQETWTLFGPARQDSLRRLLSIYIYSLDLCLYSLRPAECRRVFLHPSTSALNLFESIKFY